MNKVKLEQLINDYNGDNLGSFLYESGFTENRENLTDILPVDDIFENCWKLGELRTSDGQNILVAEAGTSTGLTERTSRKKQFEIGRKILQKNQSFVAGIFIFFDKNKNFRLSLVYPIYQGTRRKFSPYKRFSFFVSKNLPNKTFRRQFEKAHLMTLQDIKATFSLSAVTKEFYTEFRPQFDKLSNSILSSNLVSLSKKQAEDFALLFIVRVIFIGFVQKRRWIADNENFLEWYLKEYKSTYTPGQSFYCDWLEPLFFTAFNTAYGDYESLEDFAIPATVKEMIKLTPYLNGGIFLRKRNIDDQNLVIPDEPVQEFFEFIFSYNFTIEENTAYDEDLELSPEFLGVIFERLVNKDQGAIYTPRTEVDFMCRISLVKWLHKKLGDSVHVDELYKLLFREEGTVSDQSDGDFTSAQRKHILELLDEVTICDPAVGSGAFPVGMLQVLDEVDEILRKNLENVTPYEPYSRKKTIIRNSLYGVEVKEWAVWITQLRLWITLFIDAPDTLKNSLEPILPTLDFKIRQGDSLVQRLGNKLFPVQGITGLSAESRNRMNRLIDYKLSVFENEVHGEDYREKENILFREILVGQIKVKKAELENLRLSNLPKQAGLFGVDDKEEQKQVSIFNKLQETLVQDIDRLRNELDTLETDRPLIWAIEFAEIFAVEDPGFDIVIGNPPYYRSELISDPLERIATNKDYKRLLVESVKQDFDLFKTDEISVSGNSNLFTFFYSRGLKLLNSKGILTYICQNSVLDAQYTHWLQYLLLRNSSLDTVFDNHIERSFEEADVNTVITVLHSQRQNSDAVMKFVAFKKPYEEVIFSKNLIKVESRSQPESLEDFRILSIPNSEMLEQSLVSEDGKINFRGSKWGSRFLISPEILISISLRNAGKTLKLRSFIRGERYLNTGGADGFFIIKNAVPASKGFFRIFNEIKGKPPFVGEIEAKYLVPLVKDYTKNHPIPVIGGSDAFCLVLTDVKHDEKINAYIEWGAQTGFNRKSVTKTQKPWYKPSSQMKGPAELLLPRSFNDRFVCYLNPNRYLSLRFYRFHMLDGVDKMEMAGFLNSTLFWLYFESFGNRNQGQGVLDVYMDDLLNMDIPLVLNQEVAVAFQELGRREVKSIFLECGIDPGLSIPISEQEPNPLLDRAALDKVVFDALQLTDKERKDVYRAVCELVYDRLTRARSLD